MKALTENIFIEELDDSGNPDFEVIERKGVGHPDTLADALAEELSRTYSNYTKSKFGAVLHHNFDKVGLLGGHSHVSFGNGYLTHPIRVLLNGRVSWKFGNNEIPVRKMLEYTTRDFLKRHFPNIDKERDIEIHFNISTASSPGKVDEDAEKEGTRKFWFQPRNLKDLRELTHLGSNDTSLGCGYAPLSRAGRIVLALERLLNSIPFKKTRPWLGSDIKIMASRMGDDLDMTICIPQIADHVPDVESYKENIKSIRKDIVRFVKVMDPQINFTLHTNTRDDFDTLEMYLTAIGSSIESGDEGLVGRGNRVDGLITPRLPMAMEGACGKNPVYHVGKIYNVAARIIAQKLHALTGGRAQVFLISQSGRALQAPWKTIIALEKKGVDEERILSIVKEELRNMPNITDAILRGEVGLY